MKILWLSLLSSFVESTVKYKQCSRVDEFCDEHKSSCLITCIVGALTTFDEAKKICRENQMVLMDTENQKFRESFIPKFSKLFDKDLTFWVREVKVNGSLYRSVNFENNSMTRGEDEHRTCNFGNCLEKHWSICQDRSGGKLLPRAQDDGICAIKEEVFAGDRFLKTICLVGRKMPFNEAKSNCESRNMSLLETREELKAELHEKARNQLGASGSYWLETSSKSCQSQSLSKNLAEKVDCDKRVWTFCETSNRKPIYSADKCGGNTIIFDGPLFKKQVCSVQSENNYHEASAACEAANMSLLTVENDKVEAAFFEYARSVYVQGSYLWVDRLVKRDDDRLFKSLATDNEVCVQMLVERSNCRFRTAPCSLRTYAFCSKTTYKSFSDATLCARKQNLMSPDGTYLKSICEITKPQTFGNAMEICRNMNMRLLIIDSAVTQSRVSSFFKDSSKDSYWINGQRNGSWFSQSPEKIPLFPGLVWSAKRTAGDCLGATLVEGKMIVGSNQCEREMSFLCENHRSE